MMPRLPASSEMCSRDAPHPTINLKKFLIGVVVLGDGVVCALPCSSPSALWSRVAGAWPPLPRDVHVALMRSQTWFVGAAGWPRVPYLACGAPGEAVCCGDGVSCCLSAQRSPSQALVGSFEQAPKWRVPLLQVVPWE